MENTGYQSWGHMSMKTVRRGVLEFGYFPDPLDITTEKVGITPLPRREAATIEVSALSQRISKNWIYPPKRCIVNHKTGEISIDPSPERVFGLPRTHMITHSNPDSEWHLAFHLWSLSFFKGIRLTAANAGFLDATPLEPNTLNDFILVGDSLPASVDLAEEFWCSNRENPEQRKRFAGAIHALFLAQYPQALQFERFNYLYTALDTCFKIVETQNTSIKSNGHKDRVKSLCSFFGVPIPEWAELGADGKVLLSVIRNATTHEGLFMEEPLGFALHGADGSQNLAFEMRALVCRLLVAIAGGNVPAYVRSPVNTRQKHGLKLA